MRIMKTISCIFLSALLTGCTINLGVQEPIDATEIILEKEELSLERESSVILKYNLNPFNATNEITWSSSNSNVASVDKNGEVLGVANGEATITVMTDNGLSDTCLITVTPIYVKSISLSHNVLSMSPNTTFTISANVYPENADDKTVTWSSSNSSVASISNGVITSYGEGETILTATSNDGGHTATCELNVMNGGDPNSLWDITQNNLRTGSKQLNFYNINDSHGALEYSESNSEPGIRKLSTYFKNKQAANPEGYVFTSSGDMWQGSADSNITRGKLMIDWMNYLSFSAQAIGNHEFDWTIDVLQENMQQMNFPMLACNIIDESTNEPVDWIEPYTTITRNGVHIGIIGSIGEGQTGSILASNVRGLDFANPTSYVKKWSNYLKDNGADLILYLTHDNFASVDSSLSSYVDAVFLAHSHALEVEKINNKVPAVQSGSNNKYVGYIDLNYDFDSESITYNSHGYDSNILNLSDDPGTDEIWLKYEDMINTIKNRVVAYYDEPIYSSEIPYIYDQYAYKYYLEKKDEYNLDYDIFAIVTNRARASIYPTNGQITYGDVYKALPFDNLLMLIKIKGSNINKFTSYSSSRWFLPEEGKVDLEEVSSYVDSSKYYYILTIDYIAESNYQSPYIEERIYTFYEEEALPRNIFSAYLNDYPNNVI